MHYVGQEGIQEMKHQIEGVQEVYKYFYIHKTELE